MKDGIAVVEGTVPARSALRGLRRFVMYPFLFVSLNVGVAVMLILACMVAMNLLVAPYRRLRGDSVERARAKLVASSAVTPEEALRQAYPGKSPDEVREIVRTPGNARALFPENRTPLRSKHVNVTAEGYRLSEDQRSFVSKSTRRNVFFFGGSTMFGYRLPDDETIPTHFQRIISERKDAGIEWATYNFGVLSSRSKYERIFLEHLILRGWIPDVVVFLDGLNDFASVAMDLPRFRQGEPPHYQRFNGLLDQYVVDPARFWAEQLGVRQAARLNDYTIRYETDDVHVAAREMISHWRFVRGICREFGIATVFAMQPVPVVDYPLDEHPFLSEADLAWGGRFYHYAPVREGYAFLQESAGLEAVDYLDLSGLRISGSEYVDSCHYTSAFNHAIATKLVEAVLIQVEDGLGSRAERHEIRKYESRADASRRSLNTLADTRLDKQEGREE